MSDATNERPRALTAGVSTRIDDKFALSLSRYVSEGYGEPDVLWRFGIGQYCGIERADIKVDATLKLLVEMRSFADKAIEILKTDGGRLDSATAAAATDPIRAISRDIAGRGE